MKTPQVLIQPMDGWFAAQGWSIVATITPAAARLGCTYDSGIIVADDYAAYLGCEGD
jgi:hypothetical protein